MTSWIRARAPPRRVNAPVAVAGLEGAEEVATGPAKTYFYHTSDEDLLAQFNEAFYAYVYAQSQGGAPLYIYDQSNPIVPNLEVLRTTFEDLSGLVFTDGRLPNATTLNRRGQLMQPVLQGLGLAALRAEADRFFRVRSSMGTEILTTLASVTPLVAKRGPGAPVAKKGSAQRNYDAGVVVAGTGRVTALGLSTTLAALRTFQFNSKKTELDIFVSASDPAAALEELKKGADPSWTFYALPPPRPVTGGGSAALVRAKREAFVHRMAELAQLQNLSALFVPLGQPVGRFLALTAADGTILKSTDGASFAPV
jgi:hypothetical protein